MVKFMKARLNEIPAGEFKAKCLKIMDQIHGSHDELIVTKHGKPIVKIVAVGEESRDVFGCMKGTAIIKGDIINPLDVEWDANK